MFDQRKKELTSVLLVDDNQQILRMLIKLLRAHSQIVAVESAEHAIAALARARFDLIIADYKMSGKDGIWLLEYSARMHPHTKRVLHTSSPASRFSKYIQAGIIEQVIEKSISVDNIVELVTSYNESR